MKLKLTVLFVLLLPLHTYATGHVTNALITSVYCGYEGTYNMCSVV